MQFNDGQLLARFLQFKIESAFEDLIKRHATMVMAACRMVLEDGRDAEEAFQNTFMVLARKAHQHTGKESISGWLYRAAVWEALNIRSKRSVQARHIVEHKDAEMIREQEPGSAAALESMKGLLAEELNRLADKYSLPLILCYLEGKSAEQTAHDLGLSDSALKVRLMRGRELLRKRLVRRGVTVSAGTLAAVLLEQSAKAAEVVSEVLIQSTVKAAMATFSAITTAGILATGWKGALLAMTMKKTAVIIGGLVLLGLLGSIAYWKQKSLPVRELPVIVAHKQVEKPSEALIVQTGTTEQASDSTEKIILPKSIDDFLKRFAQGLKATGAEKWKILRQAHGR